MNNIENRVERIRERWRRALVCHGMEVAKAEIDFDMDMVRKAIAKRENYYDLSSDEAKALYPILTKMKRKALQDRGGKKRKACSFRLSEDARLKLEHLAEKGGVSKTAVLESLIENARRYEIPR